MSRKELQVLQRALKTMKEQIEPDQDWIKSDRAALLSHVGKTAPSLPVGLRGVAKSMLGTIFPREVIQLLRGPVFVSLLTVVFITGGSLASVSASERSLPGDFLYPVKIAAEQTRLVLTTNKSDRLKLKTEFVERRVQEIITVAASDDQSKQERVKVAAESLKRDLDTVNHQLEEVTGGSAKDSVEAAKLLDKRSTEIAKELKGVKDSLPADAKQSVSDAEAAAVNTSVKAVGVLIQSKKNPESENGVTNDELLQSITEKVSGIEEGLAETANKLQTALDDATRTTASAPGTGATTPGTTEGQTEQNKTVAPMATATNSLNEARRLLENNELDEIPEKLLLAVKAAQEAELQARLQEAEKAAQTPIPSDTSSDDTTPSTSTENTVETSETTKIKSTSTPLTGT